jgi:hypothetical protein
MRFVLLVLLMVGAAGAQAEILRCRFEPTARPMTYLQYDDKKKIAYVQSGWPQKWQRFTNVVVRTNLPPYYKKGLTLAAFGGDVPLLSFRLTYNGTTWYERDMRYPYEAYWGIAPGGPSPANTRGVCWTTHLQAQSTNQYN